MSESIIEWFWYVWLIGALAYFALQEVLRHVKDSPIAQLEKLTGANSVLASMAVTAIIWPSVVGAALAITWTPSFWRGFWAEVKRQQRR